MFTAWGTWLELDLHVSRMLSDLGISKMPAEGTDGVSEHTGWLLKFCSTSFYCFVFIQLSAAEYLNGLREISTLNS